MKKLPIYFLIVITFFIIFWQLKRYYNLPCSFINYINKNGALCNKPPLKSSLKINQKSNLTINKKPQNFNKTGNKKDETNIKFETLAFGEVYSVDFSTPKIFLINNQSLKNLQHSPNIDLTSIKNIDFSNYLVLVIFVGEVPTSGYKVTIQKIVKQKDTAKIYIKKQRPTGISAQVISYPYIIFKNL